MLVLQKIYDRYQPIIAVCLCNDWIVTTTKFIFLCFFPYSFKIAKITIHIYKYTITWIEPAIATRNISKNAASKFVYCKIVTSFWHIKYYPLCILLGNITDPRIVRDREKVQRRIEYFLLTSHTGKKFSHRYKCGDCRDKNVYVSISSNKPRKDHWTEHKC